MNLFENNITITFTDEWFQEDINALSLLILSKIANHTLTEKVIGADREHWRFSWQTSEFILNFDYYSQSCWISANDIVSQMSVLALKKSLSTSL